MVALASQLHHAMGHDLIRYSRTFKLLPIANKKDKAIVLARWGNALAVMGSNASAFKKCNQAVALDPDNAEARQNLGFVLVALKKFPDAIPHYEQAEKLWGKLDSPNRKLALFGLAACFNITGKSNQAIEKYQDAIKIDPDYAEAHFNLGVVLTDKRRFDEAIKHFERAERIWRDRGSKDEKLALVGGANALRMNGDTDKAIEKCQRAINDIDTDHANAGAHLNLGFALADREEFDKAIVEYKQVEGISRGEQDLNTIKLVQFGRAVALRRLNKLDDAASLCLEIANDYHDFPDVYNLLGVIYNAQTKFGDADKQYRMALELSKSPEGFKFDKRYTINNWANSYIHREEFDAAINRIGQWTGAYPNDPDGHFNLGRCLAAAWRYRDAIAEIDKAIKIDPRRSTYPHNKAVYHFRLGCYGEGWIQWDLAKHLYEDSLSGPLKSLENISDALQFAGILRDVFLDYEQADVYLDRVIDRRGDQPQAWAERAVLYRRWADTVGVPPDILNRRAYVNDRATKLLQRQLDRDDGYGSLLSFADFKIDVGDWEGARDLLGRANACCGGSELKGAEVARRLGLACLMAKEHVEATAHFRRALRILPGDLSLRATLGKALLRAKEFQAAREEFVQVLRAAPGHIDAHLGAAETCLELADDGDRDQYLVAERYLTDALQHGRNQRSGSKRLSPQEIAGIYYLRGYARTKRYVTAQRDIRVLSDALRDFEECRLQDTSYPQVDPAIKKISGQLTNAIERSFVNIIFPVAIGLLSLVIFWIAQTGFIVRKPIDLAAHPGIYVTMTFGSLLFMIAAVSLPNLVKLKVPGIELEKAMGIKIDAALSLNIARMSGGFRDDFSHGPSTISPSPTELRTPPQEPEAEGSIASPPAEKSAASPSAAAAPIKREGTPHATR